MQSASGEQRDGVGEGVDIGPSLNRGSRQLRRWASKRYKCHGRYRRHWASLADAEACLGVFDALGEK